MLCQINISVNFPNNQFSSQTNQIINGNILEKSRSFTCLRYRRFTGITPFGDKYSSLIMNYNYDQGNSYDFIESIGSKTK